MNTKTLYVMLIILLTLLAVEPVFAAENVMVVDGGTIKEHHVSTSQGGSIVVNLAKVLNYSEVTISQEAMDRIRSTGKKLFINCEDFSLELPANSFGSAGGSQTVIRINRRDTAKLKDYFGEKQLPGAQWKVVSDVYSFSCITHNWDSREVKSLTGRGKLSFSYKKELVTNPENVALYSFDAGTDMWVFAGGYTDTTLSSATILGDLDSYYVLLEGDKPGLTDIQGHWAESDILYLASRGVIAGDHEGKFNPNKVVTRAEFAAMLCKAFGLTKPIPAGASMGSLPTDTWYFPYAYRVNAASVLIGDPNNWKPNLPVIREDICKGIVSLSHLKEEAEPLGYQEAYDLLTVKDRSSISYSNYKYVAVMLEHGIISAKAGGWFKPYDTLTRAEVATIIARALRS